MTREKIRTHHGKIFELIEGEQTASICDDNHLTILIKKKDKVSILLSFLLFSKPLRKEFPLSEPEQLKTNVIHECSAELTVALN